MNFCWRHLCFDFLQVTIAAFDCGTLKQKPACRRSRRIERNLTKVFLTLPFIHRNLTSLAQGQTRSLKFLSETPPMNFEEKHFCFKRKKLFVSVYFFLCCLRTTVIKVTFWKIVTQWWPVNKEQCFISFLFPDRFYLSESWNFKKVFFQF